MGINLVEIGIRELYGGGAEGLPLNPRLGRVEKIIFDQAKPEKTMVKIWTGFHSAGPYLASETIEPVFLGIEVRRQELTLNIGDYVAVTGVGLLGYKPQLTAITEADSRLPVLIQTLEWARKNPNCTLLDDE